MVDVVASPLVHFVFFDIPCKASRSRGRKTWANELANDVLQASGTSNIILSSSSVPSSSPHLAERGDLASYN